MFSTEQFTQEHLARFGWTDDVATRFTPYLSDTVTPARVVRVDRGECDVITPAGPARVRTNGHALCTGDWVTVDAAAVIDVVPRTGAIQRASSSARSEAQVLAANVDTVLITTALDGDVDLGRIERMLALAWESGAQPIVVLTKSDAAEDVPSTTAAVRDVAPGAPVVPISATTGDGIDVLTAMLDGTIVLLGPSGAGKSTLANALIGREALATNEVRAADGKGRHTTVHRELFALPTGQTLIDTPGLRGVGLWDADTGIAAAFSDVEELAHLCRFDDCAHLGEPGCAVLDAVDRGLLPARRLDSYHKLRRENEWLASRSDARLRAERTRAFKVQTKALRARARFESL